MLFILDEDIINETAAFNQIDYKQGKQMGNDFYRSHRTSTSSSTVSIHMRNSKNNYTMAEVDDETRKS